MSYEHVLDNVAWTGVVLTLFLVLGLLVYGLWVTRPWKDDK